MKTPFATSAVLAVLTLLTSAGAVPQQEAGQSGGPAEAFATRYTDSWMKDKGVDLGTSAAADLRTLIRGKGKQLRVLQEKVKEAEQRLATAIRRAEEAKTTELANLEREVLAEAQQLSNEAQSLESSITSRYAAYFSRVEGGTRIYVFESPKDDGVAADFERDTRELKNVEQKEMALRNDPRVNRCQELEALVTSQDPAVQRAKKERDELRKELAQTVAQSSAEVEGMVRLKLSPSDALKQAEYLRIKGGEALRLDNERLWRTDVDAWGNNPGSATSSLPTLAPAVQGRAVQQADAKIRELGQSQQAIKDQIMNSSTPACDLPVLRAQHMDFASRKLSIQVLKSQAISPASLPAYTPTRRRNFSAPPPPPGGGSTQE